ncbi:carbohydrate sulfotransferase 15-like isoform X2 [Watersipora subatra]|uniref:carbohydrate sulfotransferase 15-like isoform X2 n=1 Tax=Watersipora subatra TaxID=2589382 RepID=UPI00355C100D
MVNLSQIIKRYSPAVVVIFCCFLFLVNFLSRSSTLRGATKTDSWKYQPESSEQDIRKLQHSVTKHQHSGTLDQSSNTQLELSTTLQYSSTQLKSLDSLEDGAAIVDTVLEHVAQKASLFHFLDISAPDLNIGFTELNITDAFAPDQQFKKVEDFTIDPLVDFFPREIRRHNYDNSTYENWLSMSFPPNANWDERYKTPCFADYNTARLRCMPHMYMVGWAKSGTTDLWWHLNSHPQLVHGFKETQFLTQFSFWPNHKDMKTFDQLLEFFDERVKKEQDGHPEKIMYDATATIIYDNWHWKIKQGYAGDPLVPTHTNFHYIRRIHPAAQIVVMMRNPTTRALSFYNHGIDMSKNNNANLGFRYVNMPETPLDIHKFFVQSIQHFNECVRKTSLRACCHMAGWESQHWGDPVYFMTLRIGIYYIFLEEVYKNFPPAQVHLIKSETFYNTPISSLTDLYAFLNISTAGVQKAVETKGTKRIMVMPKYFTFLPETYRLLQDFYRPFNQRLSDMLGDKKWLEWEEELDLLCLKMSKNLQTTSTTDANKLRQPPK